MSFTTVRTRTLRPRSQLGREIVVCTHSPLVSLSSSRVLPPSLAFVACFKSHWFFPRYSFTLRFVLRSAKLYVGRKSCAFSVLRNFLKTERSLKVWRKWTWYSVRLFRHGLFQVQSHSSAISRPANDVTKLDSLRHGDVTRTHQQQQNDGQHCGTVDHQLDRRWHVSSDRKTQNSQRSSWTERILFQASGVGQLWNVFEVEEPGTHSRSAGQFQSPVSSLSIIYLTISCSTSVQSDRGQGPCMSSCSIFSKITQKRCLYFLFVFIIIESSEAVAPGAAKGVTDDASLFLLH